jgi:hypothetical protein
MTVDESRLPPGVESFLRDHIETLEQVELLDLLMKDADKWWDARTVAQLIGISPDAAQGELERLASRNLLAIAISNHVRYRFQPGTATLRQATDELAAALRSHGMDVYRFVVGTTRRAVRDFSDAFRIRRDEPR